MRHYIVCSLLAISAACQQEGPRFTSEEDACSFAELSGWTASRERGSLLLRDDSGSRATIIVRSVPAKGDWVEPRTPALVSPAVRRVLSTLPQAKVQGPRSVRAGMNGLSFEASFRPEGKGGLYIRRHVVLFGEEADRVFHVVLTAPQESAQRADDAFERVIDSFREEA